MLNLLVQRFRYQAERNDSGARRKAPNLTHFITTANLLHFTKIIGQVAFASVRYRSARLRDRLAG